MYSSLSKSKKIIAGVVFCVLLFSLPMIVLFSQKRQETHQHASGNSCNPTGVTKNPDGTYSFTNLQVNSGGLLVDNSGCQVFLLGGQGKQPIPSNSQNNAYSISILDFSYLDKYLQATVINELRIPISVNDWNTNPPMANIPSPSGSGNMLFRDYVMEYVKAIESRGMYVQFDKYPGKDDQTALTSLAATFASDPAVFIDVRNEAYAKGESKVQGYQNDISWLDAVDKGKPGALKVVYGQPIDEMMKDPTDYPFFTEKNVMIDWHMYSGFQGTSPQTQYVCDEPNTDWPTLLSSSLPPMVSFVQSNHAAFILNEWGGCYTHPGYAMTLANVFFKNHLSGLSFFWPDDWYYQKKPNANASNTNAVYTAILSATPPPIPHSTGIISAYYKNYHLGINTPFDLSIILDGGGQEVASASAHISVSANVSISKVTTDTATCHMQFTGTPPSVSDVSFSGTLLKPRYNCVVELIRLTPIANGLATISFSNGSINTTDGSEILFEMAPGKFVIGGNPKPTPSGTITPTMTPTNTPTPSGSVSETPPISPTPKPNGTALALSVGLHGVGMGDNANSSGTGNITTDPNTIPQHVAPNHPSRTINVTLTDLQGQNPQTLEGQILFNSGNPVASGSSGPIFFTGTIDASSIPTGDYLMKISTQDYLQAQVMQVIHITQKQTVTIPPIYLITGNIINTGSSYNQLDLLDYNAIVNCFGDKMNNPSLCTTPPTQTSLGADINDDGVVDGGDYNLFIRELSVQRGQ